MALRNVGEITFDARKLGIIRYPRLVSPEQVLADHPEVDAAMAAPMFGHTGSRGCGGGLKPCTRQLDVRYDVDEAGAISNSGLTISIAQGRAVALPKNAVVDGATAAVGLYPSLVWNGQNVGSRTSESSVAGLGILQGGQLLYLVASGGTLADLGALFVARGATAAGYADAGSSAALYVRNQGYLGVHARAPKLPAWIVVTRQEASSLDTLKAGTLPILKKALPIVGGGLAALLALWLGYRVLKHPQPR